MKSVVVFEIGYSLLNIPNDIIKDVLLLLILWFIFIIFYVYSVSAVMKTFVDKIIDCCKRW